MRISTFVCLALLLALLSSCSSVAFRSEIEEQVSTWAVNGDRRYKDIKIDVHDNDGQFASDMVSVQLDSRRDEEEDWWELEFDFECKRPADEWQCLVDLKDGGNATQKEISARQEEGNYELLLEPFGDDLIISVSFCDEDTILAP